MGLGGRAYLGLRAHFWEWGLESRFLPIRGGIVLALHEGKGGCWPITGGSARGYVFGILHMAMSKRVWCLWGEFSLADDV